MGPGVRRDDSKRGAPRITPIRLIGPNRAAPFFYLVPVFGSAMAILLLGEALRPFHLIGYALVLAGVIIASRQSAGKA